MLKSMDKPLSPHDQAVEAGRMLANAESKLKKAEELLFEANVRMKKARDFEAVLTARQKKLDRAFYLLNKQKQSLMEREIKSTERETLLHDNFDHF